MDARREQKIDARIVRIFNTYGPRMAFGDGRVVSNFLLQALLGQPITIYGSGEQTRSFCYVSDLLDGLIAASRVAEFDPPVNLGNPGEYSMLELAETAMKVVGKRVELVKKPLPADDPRRHCPDISKAKRLLGFEPKIPLERGMTETCENFRARLATRRNA